MQSSNDTNELAIEWTSLFSSLIDKHAHTEKLELARSFSFGSQLTSKNFLKQAAARNKSLSLMMAYRNTRIRLLP